MSLGYKVEFSNVAKKELRAFHSSHRAQVVKIIERLKVNPYDMPNVKPIQGVNNQFRIRFGNYRMIYEIIDQRLIITVLRIGPRGDVYK